MDAVFSSAYDYGIKTPTGQSRRGDAEQRMPVKRARPEDCGCALSDRFIPSRASNIGSKFALLDENMNNSMNTAKIPEDEHGEVYHHILRGELLGLRSSVNLGQNDRSATTVEPQKLFGFRSLPLPPQGDAFSLSPMRHQSYGSCSLPRTRSKDIAKVSTLDAPDLVDDYYLNLVDWSSANVVSVGLGSRVCLRSSTTGRVTQLCELGHLDVVCSVSWMGRGDHLAVGTHRGEVQIWDVCQCRKVRTMLGHRGRVGSLAWNAHILSSGSRDHRILNSDVRRKEHVVSRLVAHRSEVCGLKWSFEGKHLASGGNDNTLFIWNMHSTSPELRLNQHQAAVKAIAWSPHQHGLLASGGGTADRCIRFWNITTNKELSCTQTGSQVCNLMWSKSVNEIVSTHGYPSNEITLWKYPSMSKVKTLVGHTYRVVYLAMSPNGQTIVTGAGDETLCYWNVFPGKPGSISGVSSRPTFGSTIR
jgi:cell division cycle 20-like protein 1 (cofactor of APC complex)